jgi:hypothetical protein
MPSKTKTCDRDDEHLTKEKTLENNDEHSTK